MAHVRYQFAALMLMFLFGFSVYFVCRMPVTLEPQTIIKMQEQIRVLNAQLGQIKSNITITQHLKADREKIIEEHNKILEKSKQCENRKTQEKQKQANRKKACDQSMKSYKTCTEVLESLVEGL